MGVFNARRFLKRIPKATIDFDERYLIGEERGGGEFHVNRPWRSNAGNKPRPSRRTKLATSFAELKILVQFPLFAPYSDPKSRTYVYTRTCNVENFFSFSFFLLDRVRISTWPTRFVLKFSRGRAIESQQDRCFSKRELRRFSRRACNVEYKSRDARKCLLSEVEQLGRACRSLSIEPVS